MGVLDKLMFWKKETVELEYGVDGCFTLPSDGTEAETAPDLETMTSTATGSEDTTPEQC